MSTADTKYAIELSNDGVSFWLRETGKEWVLQGKAALDDPNFSEKIGQLKKNHMPKDGDPLLAQIRIPRSEVFVTTMELGGAMGDAAGSKINRFLEANTPYKAKDLIIDRITNAASGKTYLAAVTKQTLTEAKEFISNYGFRAAYYTTKLKTADFPRPPRFNDGNPTTVATPVPPPPVVPKRTKPTNTPAITGAGNFETVRNKAGLTPQTHSQKLKAAFANTPSAPPPKRISIGLPDNSPSNITAPKKTETPNLVAIPPTGSLKMPQAQTNAATKTGIFKPRILFLIVGVILIALLYWFYTVLFDGKAEISRLQQISDTPPIALSEPHGLSYPRTTAVPNSPTVDRTANVENSADLPPLSGTTLAKPEPLETAKDKQNRLTGHGTAAIKPQNPVALTQPAQATPKPIAPPTTITAELTPTKQGTPGPEGITVFLGQPDIIPPRRDPLTVSTDPLKDILPKMRPPVIATIAKDAQNSLLAKADPALAGSRPKLRPTDLAIAQAQIINPSEIDIAIQQANNDSIRPHPRPKGLASKIAKANPDGKSVQVAAISPASARGTSIASPGTSPVNIQKEATEKTGLHKRRMLLIGVFGTPATRRAMLRMPSGRFVTVKPGQKISGWRVAAIGESSVRITKGSRNQVLRMPK
jgi:type IV pilus biogenesis protein PilP